MSDNRVTCQLEMYKMLRDEVQSCVERDNTLTTFMATAVATILSVAVSAQFDSPLMFLLPFCLIIPMSDRIRYYKLAIPRITSYMMQIEKEIDISYESDFLKFSNNSMSATDTKSVPVFPIFQKGSMRNFLGFYLGLLCVGFYSYMICVKYVSNVPLMIFLVLIGFLPLILTYCINRETSAKYITKRKNEYNQMWEKVITWRS